VFGFVVGHAAVACGGERLELRQRSGIDLTRRENVREQRISEIEA
jgi:hypothetical protein